MSKKLILSSLVALFVFISSPNTSYAQIVTFDLLGTDDDGGDFDFEMSTGTFTDDATGFVLDFEAFVDGSTGVINASNSNFGVNAENGFIGGNPNDAAAELDGDQGEESFSITFSRPVSATLTEVSIGGLGTDDTGILDIGGVQTAIALSLIHISEPTRRYAISYAVFCLKKKT